MGGDLKTGWDKFPGEFPLPALTATTMSSARRRGDAGPGTVAGIFLCLSASCV